MHFFEDSVTKKNKIRAHELLSSLRNVSNIGDVKKLLSKAQKRTKLLETPLPRNISDKVIIIILLTNCRWLHITVCIGYVGTAYICICKWQKRSIEMGSYCQTQSSRKLLTTRILFPSCFLDFFSCKSQAEQLVFPLKQPDYTMQTASDVTKKWKVSWKKDIAFVTNTNAST